MLFEWAILPSLHLTSSAIYETPFFTLLTHLNKYEAILDFSENPKDTKLYACLNNLINSALSELFGFDVIKQSKYPIQIFKQTFCSSH